MSKCDLTITFDRPERTYRGGEEVSGTVAVEVNDDIDTNGLVLETFWQTHGRGNRDRETIHEQTLFRGRWMAGDRVKYPFRFRAPAGPPTYRGHYLNVDHYVRARVDIPWAFDPKTQEEFVLLPGEGTYAAGMAHDSRSGAEKTRQVLGGFGTPIGVVMIVFGVIFCFPFGLILLPAGLALIFFSMKNKLAERKIGEVKIRWGPSSVAPGEVVPVRVLFTPKRDCRLNGVIAALRGKEQCISGSGTDRTTHTHKLHEEKHYLATQRELTAGRMVRLDGEVRVPQTRAFTFTASDNKLIWEIELRVDIPLWPDWTQTQVLTVRPAPGLAEVEIVEEELNVAAPAVSELALETEEREVVPVIPASPPAAEVRVEAPGKADVEAVVDDAAPEPVELQKPSRAPEPRSDSSELIALLRRIRQADRFGGERERIVAEATARMFPCSVIIENVDRTYGYVEEPVFRDGRTIHGTVDGTDLNVSIRSPVTHNADLDQLRRGARWQGTCRLVGWDRINEWAELKSTAE